MAGGPKNVHRIHPGWDEFFDPQLLLIFSSVIGCYCEIPVLTLHPAIFTTGTGTTGIKYSSVQCEISATTLQMIVHGKTHFINILKLKS
jgi:hypothetical protein